MKIYWKWNASPLGGYCIDGLLEGSLSKLEQIKSEAAVHSNQSTSITKQPPLIFLVLWSHNLILLLCSGIFSIKHFRIGEACVCLHHVIVLFVLLVNCAATETPIFHFQSWTNQREKMIVPQISSATDLCLCLHVFAHFCCCFLVSSYRCLPCFTWGLIYLPLSYFCPASLSFS